MISAPHPLSAATGLRMLRSGGNAVDAAVAAAAVGAVVIPSMNGLGGDAFLLLYDAASGHTYALNGSGPSPEALDPEQCGAALGVRDARTVCVPGAVAAWGAALERFGTRPFGQVLHDAIAAAEDGFKVGRALANDFERNGAAVLRARAEELADGGVLPRDGDRLRQPALACTLKRLAVQGSRELYEGRTAASLVAAVGRSGGWLAAPDLSAYTAEWSTPVRGAHGRWEVIVQPLVSQGILLLELLMLGRHLRVGDLPIGSDELAHRMIAATRLTFQDRDDYLGDPAMMAVPVELLLDEGRAQQRAAQVGTSAPEFTSSNARSGRDTAALTVADSAGNVVCLIQSLFHPFGSAVFDEHTGVFLNNRAYGFSLDAQSPNHAAPRKRPIHTLTNCLVLRDGLPSFALTTPGGDGQVQTIFQVLTALLDHGLSPREATDHPRWFDNPNTGQLLVESQLSTSIGEGLMRRGYRVGGDTTSGHLMGSVQLLASRPGEREWEAVADRRLDGTALGY